MKILKKENWWIWAMLAIFSYSSSFLVLAALLDVYDEEAWYVRWTKKLPKWLVIFLALLAAFILMAFSLISFVVNEETIYALLTSLGILSFFISLFILILAVAIIVFFIQILCLTAAILDVSGKELYLSPYIWIILVIMPVIGWIFIPVILLYLIIFSIVMISKGNAEKYID